MDEHGKRAGRVDVDAAAAHLIAGALVAIPTETVYGLAADALNPDAVRAIFAAKGRPAHHPLIVHVASVEALAGWFAPPLPEAAMRLADAFWPGPLTLILPRGPLAHDVVTGGLDTVGVRIPAHPLTLALLEAGPRALAAPSANRYGHVSPTIADHVLTDLGDRIAGVLDGGPASVGVESTIVDLSAGTPTILRHGGVTAAELEAVLGAPLADGTHAAPTVVRAPGQVASHYAPRARLEVLAEGALAGRHRALEAEGQSVVVLGRAELGEDADIWARSLYEALRAADAGGPDVILIAEAPAGRLEAAVRDRLRRAAAPR